uniref:3-hydroxyisobutyrate dehydrogenase n=1 Tax=Tetranychus urticae TaxID=32264 RepID=T1KPV0_TETUR
MITLRSIVKLTCKSLNQGLHFQKCHVGWIGLGFMGTPMANHLINKGNSLVVYDINSAAVVASSPAEVAEKCDRVFTMVPADPYVIEKGTILMDCSTVHPNTSKKLLQLSNDAGVDFLDTPVAGAVPAANAGMLAVHSVSYHEFCKQK